MSCFIDVYRDFPLRCARLWDRLKQPAEPNSEDLSVTAMLMVAAAGLATPFEQLKIQAGQASEGLKHPAFDAGHATDYEQTLKRVNKALDALVTKGPLFENVDTKKWRLSYCREFNKIREEAEYGSVEPNRFESCKSRQILIILRNALSHNNICAFAREGKGRISHLGFFAEDAHYVGTERRVKGWNIVTTSAESFAGFLDNWFYLLKAEYADNRPHLRLVLSKAFDSEGKQYAA